MAGGEGGDIPKFTGINKIFNSYTKDGRANIAMAAYAGAFAIYLLVKFRSKKEEPKK